MSAGRSRRGGDAQADDVEAEIKILAETAGGGFGGQVAVAGGENADVDANGRVAADAVDFALLDGAQQFGLHAHIHFADFVEQERAAMGRFEFTGAPGEGAGEGAFFVAEQLAFQQGFGNGGAVQRDERAAGAARFAVDMAGEHFLAGSGFACDEHGGFGGGDLLGAAQHGEHGGIAHDRGAGRAGGGEEHGGDEIGVRRQEQHIPRAGAHGGIGLRRRDVRAGGDDRHGDALRGEGRG